MVADPNPPKHGPNRFRKYMEIHTTVLHKFKDSGFVGSENLEIMPSNGFFFMFGEIGCLGGILISVEKQLLIVGSAQSDALVQTSWYSYNASIRGGHNIWRYDNQHEDASFRGHPDPHHKHIFDWQTGDEIKVDWIGAEGWPNLGEVIQELQDWYWNNRAQLPNVDVYPEIGLRSNKD